VDTDDYQVTEDSKTDSASVDTDDYQVTEDSKTDSASVDTDDYQVTEDSKTDSTETTIMEHSAAAKVDEEAPVVKKKRAPTKPKEVATDNEDIDDAADAKVDEEAPVVKKKRAPAKPKKAITDNEDIDDAADAKVDGEAPVAKKKRAPAKSKKATTDNEDIDDAADAKVDEAAPVAKKKRAPAKSKKATTDNEDIDDAADAKVDKEAPVAKKKRAPAPAKPKKPTTDNEDDGDATETNLPITPPVTPPKKRGRKASTADDADVNGSTPKPKASKKAKITESPEDSAEVTTSQESPSTTKTGTLRKRAAVTKDKAVARGLPTSMKECSEADRMLLHMKDVEAKPWAEIRATWKAMTGQDTASSTLPNRYNRLKVNLMALEEGDVSVTIIPSLALDYSWFLRSTSKTQAQISPLLLSMQPLPPSLSSIIPDSTNTLAHISTPSISPQLLSSLPHPFCPTIFSSPRSHPIPSQLLHLLLPPNLPPHNLPTLSNLLLLHLQAPRLLSAKASIDTEYAEYIAKFASEKWAKVQKAMEAQGTTNKYPSGFLQKEFQKLEAAGATEDNKDGDVEMADGEGSAAEGEKDEDGVKAED
jgi:hypothetical protein